MEGWIVKTYGWIYKITNTQTSEVYIGQTTGKPEARFKRHLRDKKSSCIRLARAIEKYGKEAFELKVICRAEDQLQLDHRECLSIKLFQTMSPNGYNLREGGAKGKLSEETRARMSVSRKASTFPHPSKVPVKILLPDGKILDFPSQTAAAKALGTTSRSVSLAYLGIYKSFNNGCKVVA